MDVIKGNESEEKIMVGIFRYRGGLKFVAASENEDTAIQALFDKYADDYTKQCGVTPREWWEHNRAWHNGAPSCFEIQEIEFYA